MNHFARVCAVKAALSGMIEALKAKPQPRRASGKWNYHSYPQPNAHHPARYHPKPRVRLPRMPRGARRIQWGVGFDLPQSQSGYTARYIRQ